MKRRAAFLSAILAAVLLVMSLSACAEEEERQPAPGFTLTDQYGNEHKLSDYRGKAVFLNLWTTWCPWCLKEMPEIEEIYHELGENGDRVVIMGLAAPGTQDTMDEQGIIGFLQEHGWTYPVLMDRTGGIFSLYSTGAFPATWMIRPDGTVLGYVEGALDKDTMLEIIQMALEETPAEK